MDSFIQGYARWKAQQARIRDFYLRFGFDPDASQDELGRDYLGRPASERERIGSEWLDLMMELNRDD